MAPWWVGSTVNETNILILRTRIIPKLNNHIWSLVQMPFLRFIISREEVLLTK